MRFILLLSALLMSFNGNAAYRIKNNATCRDAAVIYIMPSCGTVINSGSETLPTAVRKEHHLSLFQKMVLLRSELKFYKKFRNQSASTHNTPAVLSFILSIVSILLFAAILLPLVFSLTFIGAAAALSLLAGSCLTAFAAFILGIIGLVKSSNMMNHKGRALAIIGLVLGAGMFLFIGLILLLITAP